MQYKTLINPSFLVLMMEVQEHFRAGWEIDENNYPTANFTYYEVHLVMDETREAVLEAFKESPGEIDFSVVSKPQEAKRGRPTSKVQ